MELNEICKQAHKNAVDKAFWEKEREIPELIALCHSELSEALECDRNDDREGFEIEIADCFIRLGDMCEALGIDIETVIEKKMEINKKRPLKHNKRY